MHEVDVEAGLPVLLRVRDRESADVGHHDVETAERFGRPLDPLRECVAVAHVDDRPCDVAAAAQVVVGRRYIVGISRTEANDGPFVEEGSDDGAPDAARPSRHENSFAGELKIHGADLSLSG
jgi:hypothetical protein